MTLIPTLQTAIARLKTERDHVQQLIDQYDQLLNRRLGALTVRLAELQQTVRTKQAAQSRRRSEQDQLTVSSEQLTVSSEQPQAPNPQPSLRKLYRRAVSLAHPDLFANDPTRETRATEFMGQLNAAYEREDSETVQQLLTDWEDGLPFLDLPGHEPDPQTLARITARLTHTRDTLTQEIAILRQTEAYRLMSEEKLDLTAHFAQLEQRCLNQIELLMNQLG